MDSKVLYKFSKSYLDPELAFRNLKNMNANLEKYGFYLEKYDLAEVEKFVKFLRELLDGDEDILMLGGAKIPNRKLINHLLNEKTEANFDNLINKILTSFNSEGKINLKAHIADPGDLYERHYRRIIIRNAREDSFEDQLLLFQRYIEKYEKEFKNRHKETTDFKEKLQLLTECYMTFDDVLFQTIIYFLIDRPIPDYVTVEKVLDESILALESYKVNIKSDNNKSYIDFIYLVNKTHKNTYFKTINKIFKCLKDGISMDSLDKGIEPNYLIHNTQFINNWSDRELMEYVYERPLTKADKTQRFNFKREEVNEFMMYLHKYHNRQLHPLYMQHFKTCYREVFVNQMKFNDIKCNTIVKKLCENPRDINLTEESKFIREKISMGFFREKGLLPHYLKKNEFQGKLYEKLEEIFSSNNVDSQILEIIKIYKNISEVIISHLRVTKNKS